MTLLRSTSYEGLTQKENTALELECAEASKSLSRSQLFEVPTYWDEFGESGKGICCAE